MDLEFLAWGVVGFRFSLKNYSCKLRSINMQPGGHGHDWVCVGFRVLEFKA